MADVPGKFFSATKVRTGVAPSSSGSIVGEPLPPVNPPGSSLNSVGLTMPSAFTVSNSPLTANGTIGVAGAGTVGQYIRGDGSLADFPQASGGGSSVSYYLNGSISQGTIGGVAYKELNKVPILGAGTDFTINADGYIASFITDAGDPNLLEIPGGNWNFETYFSASSSGGTPTFYVELYKYDGTTFTLIASSSSSPELIAFGTNLNPYFSTLAVPTTTLALTDRLAIRYYVTHSGRTITLHTENNHLCQVVTTFTTGLTSLNGLTAQVQNLAVGTSGTDFNIASATATHTFNLPTASATNRGALSSADWSLFTQAYNDKINSAAVTGTTTKTLTLTQQDGGTITASWSDLNTDAVLSVFGRTGAVVAANGDYTTAQVTESGNLYYTEARVSANTDVAANTAARHNAVTLGTANGLSLSTQQLSLALASGSTTGALSSTDWNTFNSKQNALTNPVTGTGVSGRVAYWNGTNSITSDADLLFNGSELNVSGIKIDGSSIPYIISTLAGNDLNIQFPVGQGLAINNNGAENIARISKNNFSLIGASTIQTSTGNLTITSGGGNGNIILTPNGSGNTLINAGNLGLGVTPSSWNTAYKAIQFGTTGALFGESGDAANYFTTNTFVDSVGFKYITSDWALGYFQENGVHSWRNASSGTAGNAITFTTSMILNSSGNLGLGVTPTASWYTGYTAMQIGESAALFSNRTSADTRTTQLANNAYLNSNASNWIYQQSDEATRYGQVGGEHIWYNAPSGTAGNAISFTQAMTLFSDGNLLLTSGTVTNAGYKLDVNGTGRFSGRLLVSHATSGNYGAVIYNTSATGEGLTVRGGSTSSHSALIIQPYDGSVSLLNILATGAATFSSSVTATAFIPSGSTVPTNGMYLPATNTVAFSTNTVERMRITSSGLVGINTINPGTVGTGYGALTVGGSSGGGINFAATGSAFGQVVGDTGGLYVTAIGNRPIILNTNDNPRVTVTGGGNVLIGTTTNASGKLQVLGSDSTIIAQLKSSSGMLQFYPYFSTYGGPIIQALDGAGANYATLRVECTTMTVAGNQTVNGSLALPHVTKSANYTLTSSDYTVGFDCASNRTATLPDATTCSGRVYVIYQYNTGSGARSVTLDGNGSQTINGATTYSLFPYCDFTSVMIQSNGSNWIIIASNLTADCL